MLTLPTEPGSVVRWYVQDSGWWRVAILTLNMKWRHAGAWESGEDLTPEQLLELIGDDEDDFVEFMIPGVAAR